MSGPETRFIASIHKHLPPVDTFYRLKMHNQYNAGGADLWYSGRKRDLWIEYKWVNFPKRGDTIISIVDGKKPSLSVLQQHWIQGRVTEGREVWVIVGCKTGGVVFINGWESGRWPADVFKERVVTRQEIAKNVLSVCSDL